MRRWVLLPLAALMAAACVAGELVSVQFQDAAEDGSGDTSGQSDTLYLVDDGAASGPRLVGLMQRYVARPGISAGAFGSLLRGNPFREDSWNSWVDQQFDLLDSLHSLVFGPPCPHMVAAVGGRRGGPADAVAGAYLAAAAQAGGASAEQAAAMASTASLTPALLARMASARFGSSLGQLAEQAQDDLNGATQQFGELVPLMAASEEGSRSRSDSHSGSRSEGSARRASQPLTFLRPLQSLLARENSASGEEPGHMFGSDSGAERFGGRGAAGALDDPRARADLVAGLMAGAAREEQWVALEDIAQGAGWPREARSGPDEEEAEWAEWAQEEESWDWGACWLLLLSVGCLVVWCHLLCSWCRMRSCCNGRKLCPAARKFGQFKTSAGKEYLAVDADDLAQPLLLPLAPEQPLPSAPSAPVEVAAQHAPREAKYVTLHYVPLAGELDEYRL